MLVMLWLHRNDFLPKHTFLAALPTQQTHRTKIVAAIGSEKINCNELDLNLFGTMKTEFWAKEAGESSVMLID